MGAKEISVKKYVVRLSGEERERLETLIRKGKSPARRVLKARILLKADVSEAGKGWSDNRIKSEKASTRPVRRCPTVVYKLRSKQILPISRLAYPSEHSGELLRQPYRKLIIP